MRIFFFITKSEQGGAQTHVAQLTRWLIEHGHEVAVMSQPGGGTPSEALAKEGWLQEETRRLGGTFIPNSGIANTICLCRLWIGARNFKKAVSAFKPDLVACHSTMAGLMGRFSLRGRIPTIFTAHGWGFQPEAPRLRRWILPLFERLAGKYAKKIICVSRNDLELARAHLIASDDRLALVYNGVEMTSQIEAPACRTQAKACGYHNRRGNDLIRIYFVGRLAAPKNPFLLVEAFSQLPRELQDKAHITIIGDGPDRARLQTLIENLHLTTHVELTGALPREDVLERLRYQADIFVLISHWEGFPYSILEAMAVGVPVIASRVGGIPEALEHGGGILIDHDSLEQLTNALTRLITDNDLRARMGNRARQTVESTFTAEQMCEDTFNIYQDAAKAAVK